MSAFAVEALGIVAVAIMVISYALEQRGRVYVAIFAAGCAMAAIYALLLGSYPFLIAESIWCMVALQRWSAAVDLR